ncbi:5871_t:CDS:1 [Ambispora gerdemannii]|uniref:5871_t:CDS:1 n=1 Tax=Ambispora gerdemannii TaxID=144530 RepID=A0A9N8Z5W7_9GLOM|nr:5871_t:CDS:1 [Ambispora gerdemannii]
MVEKRKRRNKLPKSTNGFILYRTTYLEELQKTGKKLSMTQLSQQAGPAWNNEPDMVKRMYQKLAEDVSELLKKAHMESKEFVNKPWDIQTNPNKHKRKHPLKNNEKSKELQFLITTLDSNRVSNIKSQPGLSKTNQQTLGSNFTTSSTSSSPFVNNPPVFTNYSWENDQASVSLHRGLVYSNFVRSVSIPNAPNQNRGVPNLTSNGEFNFMEIKPQQYKQY